MPSPVTTCGAYDGCSPGHDGAYVISVDLLIWPPVWSQKKPSATFSKAMDPLTMTTVNHGGKDLVYACDGTVVYDA